jgi:hypothetical protein
MSDQEASALAHSFQPERGSPALPSPEVWGVEAERRAAAAAAE